MKWVHLKTAQDQLEAEMWCGRLAEEGIRAMIKPGDAVSFLGVSPYPTRVQVLERDLERARETLGASLDE